MLKYADPNRVNAFVQVNNQFYIRMFRVKKSYLSLGSFRNPSPKTLIHINTFGHQRSACWLVLLVKHLILVTFRKSRLGNDLFIWCHPKKIKIGIIFQFFGSQYTSGEVGKKKGQKSVKKILGRPIHDWVKESHRIIRSFLFLELLIFMY